MKDTHDMTRLELELEVARSREIIKGLQQTIEKQKYVINTYGDYIDELEHGKERKLVRKNGK